METGVYKHFKGALYIVEGIGKHSETGEELVVYRNDKNEFWIRPVSMFTENVNKDGYSGPRFQLILPLGLGKVTPTQLWEKYGHTEMAVNNKS